MNNNVNELFDFIKNSPSPFHTVETIKNILNENGFTYLKETDSFNLEKGKKYYTIRNSSSIIAFSIGKDVDSSYTFNISASHSDSPCFKVKPESHLTTGSYSKLSVEAYGGLLCAPWMDKPLSIAGRVLVNNNGKLESKLFNANRDLLIIPNLPIHFNREANNNMKYNMAIDMQPLYSGNKDDDLYSLITNEMNIKKEDVVSYDLFLYNRQAQAILGLNNEFISSPKLDDLECVYSCLKGFVNSVNNSSINVYAVFDNEEVGSTTRQGANSTFLYDTLNRINSGLGFDSDNYYKAIQRSFLVSADNAHAVQPNHPEITDSLNHAYMNEGVVIKFNASQSYTTDGVSYGIFKTILERNNIPYKVFTNRADLRGGGTLGNISTTHVSISSVDIGLAELAMHSSYETAGRYDLDYLVNAMTAFYNTKIVIDSEKIVIE